jgi:hypothetical protein
MEFLRTTTACCATGWNTWTKERRSTNSNTANCRFTSSSGKPRVPSLLTQITCSGAQPHSRRPCPGHPLQMHRPAAASRLHADYLGQPQWTKIGKSGGLCKDYGLAAPSRRVYLGNVKKNDLPELQQKLRRLFIGKTDGLFLFVLCKSCMGISTVPSTIQERTVQPPKFELVG